MRHGPLEALNVAELTSGMKTGTAIAKHRTFSLPKLPWAARRRQKKIDKGEIMVEDGIDYDMSLLAAMYRTIWKRWWLGVTLKALGGEPREQVTDAADLSCVAGNGTTRHERDHLSDFSSPRLSCRVESRR